MCGSIPQKKYELLLAVVGSRLERPTVRLPVAQLSRLDWLTLSLSLDRRSCVAPLEPYLGVWPAILGKSYNLL